MQQLLKALKGIHFYISSLQQGSCFYFKGSKDNTLIDMFRLEVLPMPIVHFCCFAKNYEKIYNIFPILL